MAEVVRLTETELQAKIDAILAEFPALKGYDPSSSCCAGCASTEVVRELGWAAANAWDELQDLYFLQGGKRERQ